MDFVLKTDPILRESIYEITHDSGLRIIVSEKDTPTSFANITFGFGSADEVNPYLVALLYAGDRADAAKMVQGWIDEGKVVIADRYVYSNIGYQCAKIEDEAERAKLRQWIFDLEYDYNKIPRPDLSLFLDVPFAFTERKLTEQREGDDRNYLNGGKDIHEASLTLQQAVRRVYLETAAVDESLQVVDCSDQDGGMALPEEIFMRIESVVSRILK